MLLSAVSDSTCRRALLGGTGGRPFPPSALRGALGRIDVGKAVEGVGSVAVRMDGVGLHGDSLVPKSVALINKIIIYI